MTSVLSSGTYKGSLVYKWWSLRKKGNENNLMAEIIAESPESKNEAIIFRLSFVLLISEQIQCSWGHFKYIIKSSLFSYC